MTIARPRHIGVPTYMSHPSRGPEQCEVRHPRPVIPPETELQEITPKALIIAILLAAVLAGANAYLGLFAGMTVSASVPAAVLSMAILRWFRSSNILENNIVQTAASSGEALAAGVIFTLPALVILGEWQDFNYWDTVTVSFIGGTLGVLFTIPLRRALVLDTRLRFPEGVATAEVLKAGTAATPQQGEDLRALLTGGVLGGSMKFAESGLRLWTDSLEGAAHLGRTVIYGGVNLSPALMAVGFIIGLPTAAVVFGGGVLGWLILLPIEGWSAPTATGGDPMISARTLWSDRIRYVGIGAMLVGGLWTLVHVRQALVGSLVKLYEASSIHLRRRAHIEGRGSGTVRTDLDTPAPILLIVLFACLLGTTLIYAEVVRNPWIASLMTLAMALAAFLFSSVAGYMAGLVGSSSNPVSGVTIATILLTASLLLVVLGSDHPSGPASALLIAAVVCCAAAMGGDNLQDLKTGQLVGATPWKQQLMQLVGVGTGAVVLAPVLSLLQARYGIGVPTDLHPQPLTAPQATLMANLSRGMFAGGLPWPLVGVGAIVATGVILVDRWLVMLGSTIRIPVLAVALGIYLPFKLTAAVMLGGLMQYLSSRTGRQTLSSGGSGLLAAAGLITGEALMGILIALPLALTMFWPSFNPDPFMLVDAPPLGPWPGVVLMGLLAWFLFRTGAQSR